MHHFKRFPKLLNQKLKQKANSIKNIFNTSESGLMFPEALVTEFNEQICSAKHFYYESLTKNLNNSLLQEELISQFLKSSNNSTSLKDNKWVTDIQTKTK